MKINSYEELPIWKLSFTIAVDIYKLCARLKIDYGLRDQMQRAAVSVPSNISEGYERNNNNEFITFLRIAKGSLGELKTQLLIVSSIYSNANKDTQSLLTNMHIMSCQLGAFLRDLGAVKRAH